MEAKRETKGKGRKMEEEGKKEKVGRPRKGRRRVAEEEEEEGSLITFSAPPVPASRSEVTGSEDKVN